MASEREEKNKAGLAEKARFLFYAEGFSRMTMETIALRLGVSKATLYKYFPNKESLLAAVVDLQMDLILRNLDLLESEALPFQDRLLRFLSTVFDTVRPAMRLFLQDVMEAAPWEWTRIDRFRRQRVFPFLSSLLKDGCELGLIRRDIDGDKIAPLLFAMIEQFGRPEVLMYLPLSMDDALNDFVRILFQGILSDSGRQEFRRLGEIIVGAPDSDTEGAKGTRIP